MEVLIWPGPADTAPVDTWIEPGPPPAALSAPWKAETGETLALYGARRTIHVHPGPDCRQAAGAAARAARSALGRRIALPAWGPVDRLIEGALLGLYRFDAYKTRPATPVEPEVEALCLLAADTPATAAAVERGRTLAAATCLARDLTNEPGGSLPPRLLAERAVAVAEQVGLTWRVDDEAALERLGAGAILAVARGSDEPPRLIRLEYRCGVPGAPRLAIVGKGVTFDAGGLQLKTPDGMVDMKTDKAGGAAVIGAMQAIARLRPPIDVLGLVPAVENLLGGRAMKPGDVLRTLSGKTIEMLNADAEGRLILADAVCLAAREGARWIVDLATLTGACVVALGRHAAGLLGSDAALVEAVRAAGADCGERCWELPVFPEYREQYRSDVADIKNVGGRWAGAITAGLIVGEFAGDVPWAHLDIAGVAAVDQAGPLGPVGATGFGVRTLVRLAERLA